MMFLNNNFKILQNSINIFYFNCDVNVIIKKVKGIMAIEILL